MASCHLAECQRHRDKDQERFRGRLGKTAVHSDRAPGRRAWGPRVRKTKTLGRDKHLEGRLRAQRGRIQRKGDSETKGRGLEREVGDSEGKTDVQRRGWGRQAQRKEERDSKKWGKGPGRGQRSRERERNGENGAKKVHIHPHRPGASPRHLLSGRLQRPASWSLCFHLCPLESLLLLGR